MPEMSPEISPGTRPAAGPEQSGCQNCSDGVQINRKTQQQSNGTAENIDDTAERECREL